MTTFASKTDPGIPKPRRVVYPVRDGKPMAESDRHADLQADAKDVLRVFFEPRAREVYVSGNNFVFWKEGDPKARVSPDVYAVFGVPQKQRDSYKAWEEGGRLPEVVIELTSQKTQAEDVGDKLRLNEQTLRVPEYYLFDPTGDYLNPRLRGYHLGPDGRYVALTLTDGDRLHSPRLGLDLVMDGDRLRFWDPAAGRFLSTLRELEAERVAEAERRAEAEAEVERLRAELETLRRRLPPNESGGGDA